MGASNAATAESTKDGRNAVAAAAVPNCRNNSLRRIRMFDSLFRAGAFVEHEGLGFTGRLAQAKRPPCSQRIPEDEAYCTTNVKGIEWTRFPDVPVIVSLYVPVRAGLFTLMVN